MPVVNRTSRQSQPKNRGAARIARSTLDNLMPVIQEQFDNALSVDGYPVVFYTKKNSGVKCSCSTADPGNATNPDGTPNTGMLPTEPGVHVLNPDGSGTEMYLNQMLQGAAIRIDRYGSRNTDTVRNPQRSQPHSPLIQSDNIINKSGSLNDPMAELVQPFDTDDLFNNDGLNMMNENLLAGNATEGCAVCLGTTFVGGYDPVNGWRTVVDGQGDLGLNNVTLAIEDHPIRFQIEPGQAEASVQFEITLPVGAAGVDCLRLWNNGVQITSGFEFQIYGDGVWQDLDEDTLLANCDGEVHSIRLFFAEGYTATEFTHFEIQLDLDTRPLYVDWPRQSESQVLTLAENLDPVQVVISPFVPNVHIFDVIAEMKNGRVWLISTVTDFVDRELSVNGWDASARLVQKHEYVYMLFVRRNPHLGSKSARQNRLQDKRETGYNPNNPNHFNRNR